MVGDKSYFIRFRKGSIDNVEFTNAPTQHIESLEKAKQKCDEYAELFRTLYEETDLKAYDVITVETHTSIGMKPVYVKYIHFPKTKERQPITFKHLKEHIASAEKDYGEGFLDNYPIMIVDATDKLWKAHAMDYFEVDTVEEIIDIGFYK